MVALRLFSPQEVRNAILEVIQSFDQGIDNSELKHYVMESLTDSNHVDMEDDYTIQRNLHDMVDSHRITYDNGSYKINKSFKKDDSDYFIQHLDSPCNDIVMLEGNKALYSVGSQYYQDEWNQLKVGKTLVIELILEKTNPYDANAVALCYHNKVLGHMTRSDASDYHEAIEFANNSGSTLHAYGEVVSSKKEPNYHFLKMFLPTADVIRRKFIF